MRLREVRCVPVEPVLTLILIAVIANIVLMGVIAVPPLLGRQRPFVLGRPTDLHVSASGESTVSAPEPEPPLDPESPATGAYDRVVRIVSWIFILATTTIVAITGLWPNTQPAIFALLAAAGMFVLVVHDLLPPSPATTAAAKARFSSSSR
jgi:hypothetical protein